jgi:hypothetical protein
MQAVTQNFGEMLEQVCPGLRDSFIEATAGNTWAEVCASDEFKDLNLPEYGSNEFYQLAQKIHADNPWLNEFDVRGQDGQPLPVREALKIKAQVSARLAAGERISPKMVMKQIAEAQQTAKKGAESRQRRVMASKSLGAGSSRGEMGESKDTSFADAINAYMQNQRSGGRR